MLKSFSLKFGYIFAAAVLLIGQISANLACSGPFYQEKVPEQLKKEM